MGEAKGAKQGLETRHKCCSWDAYGCGCKVCAVLLSKDQSQHVKVIKSVMECNAECALPHCQKLSQG